MAIERGAKVGWDHELFSFVFFLFVWELGLVAGLLSAFFSQTMGPVGGKIGKALVSSLHQL